MTYTSYFLPISAKGVVFDNNKVWLRKNERREWELPGGKVDEGEQPCETVERELREELGFVTRVRRVAHAHIYVIPNSIDESKGVLVLSFLCDLIGKAGDREHEGEAGSAKFECFSIEEVMHLNMPSFYRDAILQARDIGIFMQNDRINSPLTNI